jgi:peptide/nickel transport system substrate-binding protein
MQMKSLRRRDFLRLAAVTLGATGLPVPLSGALAGTAGSESPGSRLIGKLEGPQIITDPARIPRKFKEAPMLAETVKAGKLPPVEQRVPQEPLVIQPLHEIGKYGGTLRRGFTGPADGENGNRLMAVDKLLFVDYTGVKIVPCVAQGWKVEDGGRTIILHLRKGHKWSDGHPFTADDLLFWFEEVYQNKDLVPIPTPDMTINGKPGKMEKIDDQAVAFRFPDPYYLFLDIMSAYTQIGSGQALGGFNGQLMGAYAPAHYLKQYLPKYSSVDELNRRAKAAGFDNWVRFFQFKYDWSFNPELPVLGPWKTVSPVNKPTWSLERNPYFYEVDTEGNQLPYIDNIVLTLAENLEVLNLRAIAGEYDFQERHTSLAKLPVMLENQAKGNYAVRLDPANGPDSVFHFNQSYEADPEIAKWLANKEFRHAVSMGLDREQFNEIFCLGLGKVRSLAPADGLPCSLPAEWATKWVLYDPRRAAQLLDKIGLAKKDSEGFRLRSDGKGRLRLEVLAVGGLQTYPQQAEMAKEHWKKIGIWVDVKEMERGAAYTRINGNNHQIFVWSGAGVDVLLLYPTNLVPVMSTFCAVAPLYGKWYASGGTAGKKPADSEMLRYMDLWRKAPGLPPKEALLTHQELLKIMIEEQWSVPTVALSPANLGVRIAKNSLGNVPARQANVMSARTPSSSHPETFFYKG